MKRSFRIQHGVVLLLAFPCILLLTSCDNVPSYALTTAVSPAGTGTVTADPPDSPYPSGTEVQLTATALAGFVFDHWEGDLDGTANPVSLTMAGSVTVTAVFLPDSWAKTFGGTGSDEAFSIQNTPDGGYIVAGLTYSFGAGASDMYLVKLNSQGEQEWYRTFGGSGAESANAVRLTADGGYILAGYTNSPGSAGYDFYVVKTDGTGGLQWAKTYGGAGDDYANDILVVSGGYFILGSTSTGGTDMLLMMIGFAGNVLGSKTYGGAGAEVGESIAPVTGGGCVLAGWTTSFGAGGVDAYLVKVDNGGEVVWSKTYGGTKSEYTYAVAPRHSGFGYVLGGTANSATQGDEIFFAVTDNDGNGVGAPFGWNKYEHARDVISVSDNGSVFAGDTNSFGAGSKDFCLVKLSSTSGREWEKAFGGTKDDGAQALVQAPDGGFVLAGYTESFGAGGRDMYVVKTNANGDAVSVPED